MNNNSNALHLRGFVFTKGSILPAAMVRIEREALSGPKLWHSVAEFQKIGVEKEWSLVAQVCGLGILPLFLMYMVWVCA